MSNKNIQSNMSDDASLIINTYKDSFLLNFLYEKVPNYLKIKFGLGSITIPFSCIVIAGILPLLFSFAASSIEGSLIINAGNNSHGFLQDPTNWTNSLLTGVIFYFYFILDSKFSFIFLNFKKSEIINFEKISDKEYFNLKNDIQDRMAGKGRYKFLYYLFICLGLLTMVFVTLIYQAYLRTDIIWHDFNYPIGLSVYSIISLIFLGYGLTLLIYKILSIIISINYISSKLKEKKALILHPFPPDKINGLYPLTEVVIWLIFIALVPLGMLTIGAYQTEITANTLLLVPGYFSFLCIIFIFPIYSTHLLLKETKKDTLLNFSNKINNIYGEYIGKISYKSIDNLDQADYELNLLTNIYEKYMNAPVLILNVRVFGQIATGLLLTLLPFLLDYINI